MADSGVARNGASPFTHKVYSRIGITGANYLSTCAYRVEWYSGLRKILALMSNYSIPKIYPNLNPAAAIPVERNQIFRLRSFADNYRMSRGKEHGQYVPNSRYVFVTLMSGEMLLHPSYRHPALAEGKPVLYAGEASFNNGRLDWWSNGSGNYRPDAGHAAQASLPMDHFYPYEDVLKGVYKRQQVNHVLAGASSRNGLEAIGVQAKFVPQG
jgi:hypothetical protein